VSDAPERDSLEGEVVTQQVDSANRPQTPWGINTNRFDQHPITRTNREPGRLMAGDQCVLGRKQNAQFQYRNRRVNITTPPQQEE